MLTSILRDNSPTVTFSESIGVLTTPLLNAWAQRPKADDSPLGAVRLLIFQTRYRIGFVGKILVFFIIPFLAGVMLLSRNLLIAKGGFPIGASVEQPFLGLALCLLPVAIVTLVIWAQFRNIRRMQIRLRERLEQLEQLLAELSEESNRGETLSS